MSWEVEYTDEFEAWWSGLDAGEQVSVAAVVEVLAEMGPALQFPYSSDVRGSRHGPMRELRIQHCGRPYRILYAAGTREWFRSPTVSTTGTSLFSGERTKEMPKRFRELLDRLSQEQRARIADRRDRILQDISLKQLRRALRLTQRELAGTLRVNQAAISKMESQYDMYISTLRRFLEGMGARLKIVAEFPDGEIVISQFHQKGRGTGSA